MSIGDLCDQGRCAQILRHIAEQKLVARVAERNAAVIVAIIRDVLVEVGAEQGVLVRVDDEHVRARVAAAIVRHAGVPAQIEGVAA